MRFFVGIFQIAVLAALLWALLSGLSMLVRVAPDWPLWAVATVLAVVAWLLVWLYRYEARTIDKKRARRLLLLRLTALALITWLIIEPTFVRRVTRKIERELVILLDESASMRLVDDGMTSTRLEIARNALVGSAIEEQLADQMRIRTLRVARTAATDEDDTAAGWDQATDLAAALSTVLDQVPPDQLAGALLVSDGRHNRPARVEDSARRFGILDAPVGVVAVGSPDPPRDIAVVNVQSPDAMHLGDKMRIVAEVKFTGLRGKQANVRLLRGDELIDQRQVKIPQDDHREELRFIHLPEEGGVGGFRVEVDPLEGERFPDNNSWSFETSITEARTHVLLVDSHPRWEFRYLRNLFHGRDKSVQLQWVLTNPDTLPDTPVPEIHASAARPFGDSEATQLPENEDEWRKFDVIILGDIEPDTLHSGQWRILSRCVAERGALLVMVSGPRYMPHALPTGAARELLPAEFDWNSRNYYTSAGEPFRFGLTAQGRRHTATRQAGGGMANEQLWQSFPPIRWRHPLRGVREGAEVLLSARIEGPEPVVDNDQALGEAIEALAKRRAKEEKEALLVTRQTGRGKVALLLTDRTWRLREGAGDVHHHRFWGNLVRWGAGPLLRAGNDHVALGTDHLSYTADDPVLVTSRLRASDMSPVVDDDMQAEISRDGEVVATVPLAVLKDSQGLHQTKAGPFRDPGRYQIRILSEKAGELLDDAVLPDASFTVVASRGPIELADTTLNRPLLDEIATASGGRVVGPTGVSELASLFLGDEREREEIRETTLWDNAWIFILLAAVLTAEWLMRRNAGLP